MPERRLTSIPVNSRSPYVLFFSKGHAENFHEFWHDFAKNRTYDLLNLCMYPVCRPRSVLPFAGRVRCSRRVAGPHRRRGVGTS